jgi:hypothetical protein
MLTIDEAKRISIKQALEILQKESKEMDVEWSLQIDLNCILLLMNSYAISIMLNLPVKYMLIKGNK